MKPIPFYSLQAQHKQVEAKATAAFSAMYNDGRFVLADRLQLFEKEFAAYTGGQFCLGVGNGLDAIYISLKMLGVGAGDEVIVPSHTYIATWLAVNRTGATPVPVEADADTWLINPALVEKAITSKTKAILPVHMYGLVCDMPKLRAIADKNNLVIVEDNAQAAGASIRGKQAGTWGDCNAFSFYPTKTLGALGDGGAVVTDNEACYQRARAYRNYGSTVQFVNEVKGINSRLDEMQAGLLSVKLPYLDEWNKDRRAIAKTYIEVLNEVEEVALPQVMDDTYPVYHLFPIRVRKRNELQAHLKKTGIDTSVHYPTPPYLQKAYESMGLKRGQFQITEALADELVSLPIWPGLEQQDVIRVCDEIKKWLLTVS